MSKAYTVQEQNRNMLIDLVADRKLPYSEVRVLLMKALEDMTTFQMEQLVQSGLRMSLREVEDEFVFGAVERTHSGIGFVPDAEVFQL